MSALSVFHADQPDPLPPVLTVGALLDLYLRHCAAESVHGAEARADREYVFGLFRAAYGGLPVADCRPYHLTDFIEAHTAWRSTATRRGKANAVRAAFAWAADQERIDRNPFRAVRYRDAERRPEMPDAVLGRVQFMASPQFEVALRFLRLTWCRLSELCDAKWADVDLDRGVWTIHKHKSRRFTGAAKEVALVGEAVSLLRELSATAVHAVYPVFDHAAAGPAKMIGPEMSAPGTPIFLNTRGKPWTRRTLGQQLARMKRRHGIQTAASLHGVRHRGITAALDDGAPILSVSEQAGHGSVAITQKVYRHKSAQQIEAMRRAAESGVPKK